MRISIVVLDGVFDTGLSTILDTFSVANKIAPFVEGLTARFEVSVIGLREQVQTGQGLSLAITPASHYTSPDVILLPGIAANMPNQLSEALKHTDIAGVRELLQYQHRQGVTIGTACTGTFILAATSLLDGLRATTTWWLAPMFRAYYPAITFDESQMVVESGQYITAGAPLAHLDLALHVVRRVSPSLAALTARYMVMDHRPSQAAFVIPNHVLHQDPLIEQFEMWVREHLADGFSLNEAAASIGTNKRTLARRLQASLGKSPVAYVQDLRVAQTIQLLRSTTLSIDEIAVQVGYANASTLRTLLRQKVGRGVRELRVDI